MRFEEIVKIYSGQIITRVEAKEEVGDNVEEIRKILIPKAISNGRVIHDGLVDVKFKKAVDHDRITKEGDIIIKLSTPYDSAYITKEDEGLVVTSFCVILRGVNSKKVDLQFLTAYLNTDYVRQLLRSKVAGTTIPIIKLGDIKELELPEIDIKKQHLFGKAYAISCQKQDVLKEILNNEYTLIENIVLQAIKAGHSKCTVKKNK